MACQLTFLSGPRAGAALHLDKPTVVLGRDPRCDVAFDPQVDLLVSGRHATIDHTPAGYRITDSSSNGTFVNGQRVDEALLSDGDTIELGQGGPRLRFAVQHVAAAPPAPAAPAAPRPPTATRGQPLPSPAALPVQRPAAAPAADHSREALDATSLAGPAPVRPPSATRATPPASGTVATAGEIQIGIERLGSGGPPQVFDRPVIRIGRDPSAEVAFDPQSELLVSFNHAKIMVLDGVPVLFDLESTNGTFVGDKQIARLDLEGGEIIELGRGGPKLRVTISAKPAAEARAPREDKRTMFGAAAVVVADITLGDAELLGSYPLDRPQLVIGREGSAGCDIVLDSMYVSQRHATISRDGGAVLLRDLQSANGTFLAGARVSEAPLAEGAEFVVGPYVLKHAAGAIQVFDTRTKTWVDALELIRRDARAKRNFLDRVSLKILPGEFICILGPSGCGKSTLLKSLNGYTRADGGTVLLNNIDFYDHYEQLKHQVGYVPQDDIIHPQLSIERTLHYAAKLRLPPGTSTAKRRERIDDVLSMLELQDHRHKPVFKLSGGQRKRVSIGVELLTEPAIIYLDEPTSGLDPNLEEKMMLLLRELTLRGKTVVCVTHTLDNIHLADKVTFLVDGKLAFFGTPDEARGFFSVQRLPDVYKRFEAARGDIDALRTDFERSPVYEQHIRSQINAAPAAAPQPPRKGKRVGPGALKQFLVLTQRYVETITRDVRNTAILLLQAPLVALFICAAVKTDQPERGPTSTMFLILSLSALWFGCSNAAREVTKEAAIYARERMVNLRVIPYVASKFFVLQFLALLQVTTMLVIVYYLRGGYDLVGKDVPHDCMRYGIAACQQLILPGVPGDFWLHLLNLYLTALNGVGLGLLVSALAGNSDKAMSLVPLILIPQVLFSGSFGIPKHDELLKRSVGYAMALNWSLDQSKRIAMCTPEEEQGKGGCTTCLHAFDPFKHSLLKDTEDQDEDRRCEAILPVMPTMFDYPETLEVVEDGLYTPPGLHGQGKAREANKSYIPLFVLGGYALLSFILVCIFVRLKDRQNR